MLLGKRLRGRHERRLGTVLDGAQHGGQGNASLARSHFSHQQALHRPLLGDVRVDLLDRALLVARELERERPSPAVHHHAARLERPGAPPLAPGAPASRHGELQQEQLLEGEPTARVALVLLADREVHRLDGGRPLGEVLLDAQPRRQRLDHREHSRAGLAHELPQARRTDAVRGRVHGHEPERVDRRLAVPDQLVLCDPELVALTELAVEEHQRALAELARDPGLVEPDGEQRPALVEDTRLHALLAPVAHRLDLSTPNRDRNGGLLTHHQLGDSPHLTPVPVRVREVLDQFAPGRDGERLEPVNRLGEDARARVGPNGVGAQLIRGQGLVGCKANRQVIHMIAVTAGGRGGRHGCSYQHHRLPGGRRH